MQQVTTRQGIGTFLRYSGLGLIVAVLLLGPFFKGLFFPQEQYTAQALVGAGFLLWLGGRWATGKDLRPFRGPVEWAGLALLVSYLLASFVAVYPQGHLIVLLQLTSGLLLFCVLREEVADQPSLALWLALGLVAAGLGVTLVGLAPHIGLVQPEAGMLEALALVGLETRLSSTFQYPNTFAAYVLVLWITLVGLCLHGLQHQRSSSRQTAYAATLVLVGTTVVGYTFFLAFLLAASRGAVLVLPLGLAILLLGLSRGQRLTALLLLMISLAPAVAVLKGVVGNAALQDLPRVLKWFGVGLGATCLGGATLALWLRLSVRVRTGLLATALLLALMGTGWFWQQHGSPARLAEAVLPDQAHRLLDLNWRTQNALLRLIYYQDSLHIMVDRPFTGAGGRAWERLYPEYQEFRYVASEVHGHWLQVGTEAGTPGLASFVALWATMLYGGWRARRQLSGLTWGLVAALLTLGGHSLIDFNLSYLSLQYLMWALAALVLAARPTNRAAKTTEKAEVYSAS